LITHGMAFSESRALELPGPDFSDVMAENLAHCIGDRDFFQHGKSSLMVGDQFMSGQVISFAWEK
jgi:hypothetical protein